VKPRAHRGRLGEGYVRTRQKDANLGPRRGLNLIEKFRGGKNTAVLRGGRRREAGDNGLKRLQRHNEEGKPKLWGNFHVSN